MVRPIDKEGVPRKAKNELNLSRGEAVCVTHKTQFARRVAVVVDGDRETSCSLCADPSG